MVDSYYLDDYYSTTINLTEALGRTGRILRSCYAAGGQVGETSKKYASMWDSAYSVYKMIRKNVI